MEIFKTGIETLDDLLGGGFPRPSAIGILGDVGAGKTILCLQIMWNALMKGFNVLFYLTIESEEEMKENLLGYGVDLSTFEKEKKLKIVDIFSRGVKLAEKSVMEPEKLTSKSFNFYNVLKEGSKYYLHTIKRGDLLVIFNSLSPIFLTMEHKKTVSFLQSLRLATRVGRCVGIATLHTKVHDEKIENIVRSYADGVIEMNVINKGTKILHRMRIPKMSRSNHYEGECSYSKGKKGLIFSKSIIE